MACCKQIHRHCFKHLS